MKTAIVIAAFGALLAGGPAMAQDAANIAAACNAEGGFGLRFGQSQADVGPTRPGTENSRFIDLSGEWSAWEDVEAVFTPAGRKLHSLNAELTLADPAAAQAMAREIRQKLPALGLKRESEDLFVSQPPAKPWRMEISTEGRELYIVCADKALRDSAFKEFLNPPRLTAAPVPPKLTPPPLPAADACATPDSQVATAKGLKGRIEEAVEFGQTVNRYGDELARWKSQQFVERGLWTKADETRFHAGLLGSKEFMSYFNTSLKQLMGMMTALTRLSAAEKAGDPAGQCQAAIDGVTAMHRLVDSVTEHWAYLMGRYEAEAKRLGVTIA